MRVEDVVRAMEPWRAQHLRSAWRPHLRPADGEPGLSRFGGTPDLRDGEPWPGCEVCWGPLSHALQLDLDEVPTGCGMPPGRLLQVFYCGADCLFDWERNGRHGPPNRAGLARIIDRPGSGGEATPPPGIHTLPAWEVVGWEQVNDYPSGHDHDSLGLIYDYMWSQDAIRLEWPQGGLVFEWVESLEIAEAISDAQYGHKLCGWPKGGHSPHQPDCNHCGQPMGFMLQIDGESSSPGSFYLGYFYVWQCAEHPDAVAFSHSK